MPFVSQQGQREVLQGLAPYEDVIEPDFSDVFAASVGLVFDEELSISGALNREGWGDRRRVVSERIERGDVNREEYTDRRGRFDYDRLARELEDPAIKTDGQLTEERNNLLKSRRDYATDVIERGNGAAQFLGAATGYMLDPISIATMGIGTAATGAKSLSIAGRAFLTARNTAALEAAAELAIQPLVFEHKHDINSPFSETDAIANIAAAAIGGGILGGITGGISGYLGRAIEKTKELPETPELTGVIGNLERLKQTVSNAPEKGSIEGEEMFLNELNQQRSVNGAPSKTQEQYEIPERTKPQPASTINRQGEVLDAVGLKQEFDADMAAFEKLDKPVIIDDGDLVDAKAFMKGIDDELDGIESVLVCTRG